MVSSCLLHHISLNPFGSQCKGFLSRKKESKKNKIAQKKKKNTHSQKHGGKGRRGLFFNIDQRLVV